MHKKKVLVTGVGLITPLGIGVKDSWNSLIEGRPGIRRITHFDSSNFPTLIAGEVEGFKPEDYIEPKEIKTDGPFYPFCYCCSIYGNRRFWSEDNI